MPYPKYYIRLLQGGFDPEGKPKDKTWSGDFSNAKSAESHYERYRFSWEDTAKIYGFGIFVIREKGKKYELVKILVNADKKLERAQKKFDKRKMKDETEIMRRRHDTFLVELEKNGMSISLASQACNIYRGSHSSWRKKYPDYEKKYQTLVKKHLTK